jgi:hypothetical protein
MHYNSYMQMYLTIHQTEVVKKQNAGFADEDDAVANSSSTCKMQMHSLPGLKTECR